MTELHGCKELLSDCFTGGLHFAGDLRSRAAAVDYLRCLVVNLDVWLEVEKNIRDYLPSQNVPDDQVQFEIETARRLLTPWLP